MPSGETTFGHPDLFWTHAFRPAANPFFRGAAFFARALAESVVQVRHDPAL
jgi:hypothetical protein